MAQNIFKLVLTDEAQNFIESLPEAVDLLQHQACCRWRTQQRTLQEVGKLGDMGISYIV